MHKNLMKKSLVVLATLALLFSACGKEGEPEEVLGVGSSSPTPTATTSSDTSATAKPSSTAAAATTGPSATTTTTADTTDGTPTPVKPVAPGESQPPADGRYVYTTSGKTTDPSNPAAGPQSFEGESYNEVSHSGDTYTFEGTSSESAGRTVLLSRWGTAKVELLELSIETPIGTYKCAFDPALVITKFPIKAEKYPTQNFKGEGNACDGKIDITIEKQETVKDANGDSHDTWRAKVRTEVKSTDFQVVLDETRWASPDLGIEVRSHTITNGTAKSGAFTGKIFSDITSVLKERP